jgi:endonuclease/exonuclease/phosphatase family metal-dependent hydrolase
MKLFSWNIHKGIGGVDRRYNLQRIIDVIVAESPDVVCLQEVDRGARRSRLHDQPHLLSEALALPHMLYQPNVRLKVGGYGNLILSRWPFRSHHHISLKLAWRKPRGAQLAVIDLPNHPLQVVNWHLGLAETVRVWQTTHLLTHRLFVGSSHLPTAIIGDTNDWRNNLENGPFRSAQFSHVTHPVSRFRSFPAWAPLGALDKLYIRGPITVDRCHMIRTRLSRRASDHLPLVAELTVG